MVENMVDSSTFARSFMAGTIHMSFAKAYDQLGLPSLSNDVFIRGLLPHLEDYPEAKLWDHAYLNKLWMGVLKGEVIAFDVWEEALVFYVRGGYQRQGIVLRLIYIDNVWKIDTVVSIYERQLFKATWFRNTSTIAAVVVAAFVGFLLHGQNASSDTVASSAVLMTKAVPAVVATTKPTTSDAVSKKVAAQPATKPVDSTKAIVKKVVVAKSQVKQQFVYDLPLGGSLYNLAAFLKSHHLITGAENFDMLMKSTGADQNAQPGKYIFTTGMSQAQMIQVIKHGPKG